MKNILGVFFLMIIFLITLNPKTLITLILAMLFTCLTSCGVILFLMGIDDILDPSENPLFPEFKIWKRILAIIGSTIIIVMLIGAAWLSTQK